MSEFKPTYIILDDGTVFRYSKCIAEIYYDNEDEVAGFVNYVEAANEGFAAMDLFCKKVEGGWVGMVNQAQTYSTFLNILIKAGYRTK